MIRQHWDRLAFMTLFAGYGVYAAFVKTSPNMAAVPRALSYPTYALFVIAAVTLLVGLVQDHLPTSVLGHVLAIIAALTVAGCVLAGDRNAGGFLLVAIAVRMVISMRALISDNRSVRDLSASLDATRNR